jgi:hypothetical protein
MTKKDKIGWLLMTPFLSVLAGSIIFGSYMVITEAPWWVTAGVTGLFAAVVGLFMLLHDPDDATARYNASIFCDSIRDHFND